MARVGKDTWMDQIWRFEGHMVSACTSAACVGAGQCVGANTLGDVVGMASCTGGAGPQGTPALKLRPERPSVAGGAAGTGTA